jgi:hypothetical protein
MKLPFELYTYHDQFYGLTVTLNPNIQNATKINAIEVEWIEIKDEDDYRYFLPNKPEIFKYYPEGDTFDDLSYYETEYVTVLEATVSQAVKVGGELTYNIIQRIYSPLQFNVGITTQFPYSFYIIKRYEDIL